MILRFPNKFGCSVKVGCVETNIDLKQKMLQISSPSFTSFRILGFMFILFFLGNCLTLVLPWNVLEFLDGLNLITERKVGGTFTLLCSEFGIIRTSVVNFLYPPQRSGGGVYWNQLVRPSVCLSVCLSVCPSPKSCPENSSVTTGRILFKFGTDVPYGG